MRSGRLEDLGEDPEVKRDADGTWRVTGPVEGASLTVLLEGDAPRVLVDDRTVPDADHARVKLLDLRPPGERKAVFMKPREVGEAMVELPMPQPTSDVARYGREIEIDRGEWTLETTGERLSIKPDNAYLIVLRGSPEAATLSGRVRRDDRPGLDFNGAFLRSLDDFGDAIRERREPAVPAREGRRAVELIEACYAAKEPLDLPWMRPRGAGA